MYVCALWVFLVLTKVRIGGLDPLDLDFWIIVGRGVDAVTDF